MNRLSFTARAWLALGLVGGLVAPARAFAQSTPEAPPTRFDHLLAACDAVGWEAAANSLAAHGANAVEWIVKVRLGRIPTAAPWEECQLAASSAALRARASRAREAVLSELFSIPEQAPYGAAMRTLAELGDEADLPVLLDWAVEWGARSGDVEDPAGESARALRESVHALAKVSAADRRGWERTLKRAPDALRWAIVRGLADAGGEDALLRVAEQLGGTLFGDSFLLAELSRSARRIDRAHSDELQQAVRACLNSRDDSVLRDAALCTGALGDEASAEALIALLEHEHPGVRSNAEWSLVRLTGRRLGPAPAAWRRWIESERAWWRDDAPVLLQTLAGSDPHSRIVAVQTLAAHRFPRHALASGIASSLPLGDPGAVAIGCAALRQLRSWGAGSVLCMRLEPGLDPAVSEQLRATAAALGAPVPPPSR